MSFIGRRIRNLRYAGWKLNVRFSEKDKAWFKDKGLMAFIYQELRFIDEETDLLESKSAKYKCIQPDHGYEHCLTKDQIYTGIEVEGIFSDRPFLEVYKDNWHPLCAAHLSRFTKIT